MVPGAVVCPVPGSARDRLVDTWSERGTLSSFQRPAGAYWRCPPHPGARQRHTAGCGSARPALWLSVSRRISDTGSMFPAQNQW